MSIEPALDSVAAPWTEPLMDMLGWTPPTIEKRVHQERTYPMLRTNDVVVRGKTQQSYVV